MASGIKWKCKLDVVAKNIVKENTVNKNTMNNIYACLLRLFAKSNIKQL